MSHQKRYTASDKVKILREHLQSGISISELSRKYGVHPNVIMNWRKKLFEGASDIFSGSRGKKTKKGEEHINNLREEVNRKDKIISRVLLQMELDKVII